MKAGGEYIYQVHFLGSCHPCVDTYDAQGGPVPANIEDLFPDILDASTWNLDPLRSITRSFQIGVGAYMKRIPAACVCRLGAGRLADGPPDAEPRTAV